MVAAYIALVQQVLTSSFESIGFGATTQSVHQTQKVKPSPTPKANVSSKSKSVKSRANNTFHILSTWHFEKQEQPTLQILSLEQNQLTLEGTEHLGYESVICELIFRPASPSIKNRANRVLSWTPTSYLTDSPHPESSPSSTR